MTAPRFRVLVAGCGFPSLEPERRILAEVGAEVLDARDVDAQGIAHLCPQVDALLCDYVRVDRPLIAELRRCRVICQYGIGLDSIDVAAATERGIVVTHTPDYCTDEVADHALALLLCLWRKLLTFDRSVRAGCWDYNVADPVHRIRGRVLGLVGFGRIARNLASKARAVGFTVLAHDPWIAPAIAHAQGVELCSLVELLERADAVSLHAPLNPASRHLIGAEQLRQMKPTAVLINTARGDLVDQAALAAALAEGRLAAAGLDVLASEPPGPAEPLLELPNVVITPHAAFYSREALAAVQTEAATAVAAVLRGHLPLALANPDVAGRLAWITRSGGSADVAADGR